MASSDHLKPGEKGEITAKVNTNGKSGTMVKTVKVMSNDPNSPEVVLQMKANIINPALPINSGQQIIPGPSGQQRPSPPSVPTVPPTRPEPRTPASK